MATVPQLQALQTQVNSSRDAMVADATAADSRVTDDMSRAAWRQSLPEIDQLSRRAGHAKFLRERLAAQSRKLAREIAKVQAGGTSSIVIPTLDTSTDQRVTIPRRPTRGTA